jgi:dsDNA-binding SOS-regulon protein
MAVITRYVVVRNGVELDQVFSVKKEAEAYDKMLDAAENLAGFIKSSEFGVPIDEPTIDAIAILLAKNGPEVVKILKGIKPVMPPSEADADGAAEMPSPSKEKKTTKSGPSKRRGK